jgi:UDP-GlcNAc:undecaprenyl-phosphate GlcNAc-1-phosphate transferase
MTLLPLLALSSAAAVISYALAPLAGQIAVRLGALDMPGPRKIHTKPIPRLGGLAVVAAIFIASPVIWWLGSPWPMLSGRVLLGIGVGVLPVVAVSIVDDMRALKPGPKFLAHLGGAMIAVACGVTLAPQIHLFGYTIAIGPLAMPLSVLWIVGLTNAFNIVDGLDGLSAGLALISSVSLAGVFLLEGHAGMAGETLVLAGALAGFLPYNMYPARMFLGDTGATTVGFCLAGYALKGGATLSGGFATLLPVFVLGLPIAETLISVTRRLVLRFERSDAAGVFQPDRNHMHHRLLALGIDHPRAVRILYSAGVLMAATALVSMFMTAHDAALLLLALLLAGVLGVRRLGYDEFAVVRNGAVLRVYEAPALRRSMFVVFIDVFVVAVGACAAMALKTDDWSLASHFGAAAAMTALLAPITVAVFWQMGLYRGTWSLAGPEDFARACSAVLVAAMLACPAYMFITPSEPAVALFAIYALIALVLVAATRGSYQLIAAAHWRSARRGAPALIYGAGRQGVTALQQLATDAGAAFHPVAFIDDDPGTHGKVLHGLPIVGSGQSLEHIIKTLSVRAVVVASDTITDFRLAAVRGLCAELDVAVLKMQISFDACDGTAVEAAAAAGVQARAHDSRDAAAVGEEAFARAHAADGAASMVYAAAANAGVVKPGAMAPAASAGRTVAASAPADITVREQPRTKTAANPAAGIPCPTCGSFKVHRSHVASPTERVRKRLSQKRLFRCEACGWRGWRDLVPTAVFEVPPATLHRGGTWDSIDALFAAPTSNKLAS